MGGSLSTIRWTPYGPIPDSSQSGHHRQHPLRKSKSYPPPPGNSSQHSPSNSTSNLSYEQYTDDEDELLYQNNGNSEHGHAGTSGILMGANAPPLYDACLVGRWDDVLEICGVQDTEGEGSSNDSPNGGETATTHCSSSSEKDGTAIGGEGGPAGGEILTPPRSRQDDTEQEGDSNSTSTGHPCLQTRYTDRRRNTPLHLACRRQPPPSVVRALLNHSQCEAVSRRTADGLTPLHFAAYCGAGVEVVSMLVDRMRSDAAVGRAMRLSSALTLDENNEADGRWRLQSEESMLLPPTRLLDRRQRTPLHCALSGFRTPIRPTVVRTLLAVDPASATLGDERSRTPLSLLFDDYAEEIMEALEEDIPASVVQERIKSGGELHECWKMLRVLLQAAYQGSVSEDEEENVGERPVQQVAADLGHQGAIGEDADGSSVPAPQAKEVNVMEIYDHEHFSMVHAAAGVWECPAPLAKLVLKCQCSTSENKVRVSAGIDQSGRSVAMSSSGGGSSDWANNAIESMDGSVRSSSMASMSEVDIGGGVPSAEKDLIRQRDEETMRLPLHIAVCARPQSREGYGARLKVWLNTPEASRMANFAPVSRRTSGGSVASGMSVTGSVTSQADTRGRSPAGQVYNPRFGRSPSRDSVAFQNSSSMQRGSSHSSNNSSSGNNGNNNNAANTATKTASNSGNFQSFLLRSGSNSSISTNLTREPFLQHTMVRDVLELYPAAAAVVDDRTGKIPIVLAIEHGKSWETAVGPLLDAFPTPFGGGGDGGMALPDDSPEGRGHRAALQAALFLALSSPESFVREEAIRTAGKLAKWGGVYGMTGSLDGIVSEWLDTMVKHSPSSASEGSAAGSPEGIIVGPGATTESDWIQIQSSNLTAVAEVVSQSRPDSISDRVARLCLDSSREYLFSKDGTVREAAARVLGNTLNSVGDADDAANVIREVVLNITNEEGSMAGSTASPAKSRRREDDVIVKHGRLLACNSILSTQWGSEVMATEDIRDAIITFIHKCVKDKNTVVRSAAYYAMGSILGKGPAPEDPKLASTTVTTVLKEVRSDILKGTRAKEQVDVQLALARGLTLASRIRPGVFLCKSGMPIMDAALMLAMSSSNARPNVQKAFQIFLWVALRMGRGENEDHHHGDDNLAAHGSGGSVDGSHAAGNLMSSPGLEKYIKLAEGENGRIMMKFVTQTLAKIEDLDDQGGLVC